MTIPAVELGSVEWDVRIGIKSALLLHITLSFLLIQTKSKSKNKQKSKSPESESAKVWGPFPVPDVTSLVFSLLFIFSFR